MGGRLGVGHSCTSTEMSLPGISTESAGGDGNIWVERRNPTPPFESGALNKRWYPHCSEQRINRVGWSCGRNSTNAMKSGMGENVNCMEVKMEQNLSRQMEPPMLIVAKDSGTLSPGSCWDTCREVAGMR